MQLPKTAAGLHVIPGLLVPILLVCGMAFLLRIVLVGIPEDLPGSEKESITFALCAKDTGGEITQTQYCTLKETLEAIQPSPQRKKDDANQKVRQTGPG